MQQSGWQCFEVPQRYHRQASPHTRTYAPSRAHWDASPPPPPPPPDVSGDRANCVCSRHGKRRLRLFRVYVASSTFRYKSEAQTVAAEPRRAIQHQNELEPSPRILSIVKASITTSYIPSIPPTITSTPHFLSPASNSAASHTSQNAVLKVITECK